MRCVEPDFDERLKIAQQSKNGSESISAHLNELRVVNDLLTCTKYYGHCLCLSTLQLKSLVRF